MLKPALPLACILALATCTARAQGVPNGLAAAPEPALAAEVERVLAETVRVYKWFHAHPELSGQEVETSKRMAKELRAMGLEVYENIGGHGVVGILRGKRNGPVVLYRADMDALPVTEKTGVPYASKRSGVMHACGHDIHMATALGTLRVLAARKDQWSGTVLFVGEPAEEIGAGSRKILADPAFKRILDRSGKPRIAVAIHDASNLPAGTVAIKPGYISANVDTVDIVVHGKGGHGAFPHDSIDPVVIGAEIVMALQTVVSRRIAPGEMGVVTVGMFQGGTKHNIIPSNAKLLLTVRSYASEVRARLLGEIERVARNVASAHNAPKPPTITRKVHYTPAGYNDPAWTKRLEALFRKVVGEDNVHPFEPSMGGEDFSRFAIELGIPSVMWRIGGVNPQVYAEAKDKGTLRALPTVHSDKWAPDPAPTLRTGIHTMTAAILHILGSPAPRSR